MGESRVIMGQKFGNFCKLILCQELHHTADNFFSKRAHLRRPYSPTGLPRVEVPDPPLHPCQPLPLLLLLLLLVKVVVVHSNQLILLTPAVVKSPSTQRVPLRETSQDPTTVCVCVCVSTLHRQIVQDCSPQLSVGREQLIIVYYRHIKMPLTTYYPRSVR